MHVSRLSGLIKAGVTVTSTSATPEVLEALAAFEQATASAEARRMHEAARERERMTSRKGR